MFKQLFACVALATMVMTIPVNAQSSPPTSAKANALAAEKAQLESAFSEILIDQAATSALAEAKGSVELLLPHVQRHTRVRKLEDGRRIPNRSDS